MDRSKFHIDLHAIARQAMEDYGFIPSYPRKVIREVQQINEEHLRKVNEISVKDMRGLLWSSIDNVDSLDLDQIEYCEYASNNEIRVLVAIADVDELVPKRSQTDLHARHNGTSVYTGVEIFPMLPEQLSANLTSLKQDEDRLAVVSEYFVKKDGELRCGNIYRALIRNKAKLIYESLGDWLEGNASIPELVNGNVELQKQIRLQDEAAQRLHQFRMASGNLELDTIEASPLMKDGQVAELVVKKKNRARYLIENFMIAANETMVNFLEKRNFAVIQRVVPVPEEEKWEKIRAVALALGTKLPPNPESIPLSQFLKNRREADPERFPDLSLTIVKLLGAGEYEVLDASDDTIGHFGLAVHDYTHSTAPNRRYVDVVIQRMVKSVLAKAKNPYSKKELTDIALWCTDRDKSAKKVERFMRKVAGAMLMRGRIGDVFEGIVTGASSKGTYVRVIDPPVEGRVVQGGRTMNVGDKVRVRLMNMVPEKGFIDFEGMGGTRKFQ